MQTTNLKLRNIWSHRCVIISLYLIFFPCFAKAQSIDSVGIRFTSDNEKVKDRAIVLVEQVGVLQSIKFKEEAHVKTGIPFNVSFENIIPKPPPLFNLRVFKDTILSVGNELLAGITLIAKKYTTVQTLSGFEYKPYLDSDYLYKPLYYALEKLPFITAGLESISYKNGERILFMINGKERPGLLSWNELLKTMPAKQIYKVKMITELPPNIANRGFSIILDILTLDVNVYGHVIAPVLFWDSRNNFQPNLTTNWLKKRFDFSLNASFIPDKFNLPYWVEVYENGTQISHTSLFQKYSFNGISLKGGLGYRINPSAQLSISSGFDNNIVKFYNEELTNNFQPKTSYLKNQNQTFQTGMGFIYAKTEEIATGIGISYESRPTFQYKYSQFVNSNLDSNQIELSLPTKEVIAELYHNNFKDSRLNFSYGLQGYFTKSQQSSFERDKTTSNEPWNTSFNPQDSINFSQVSVSGYIQTVILKKKRSFTFYFNSEYYRINSLGGQGKDYLLPTITYVQKEMLKKNRSLKFRASYDYLKPNLEYLIPAGKYENAFEIKYGYLDVLPEKSLSASIELTNAAKFQLSQKIQYTYNYDRLRFITEYDSLQNLMISRPQNNGTSQSIGYYLNYSKLFSKKFRLYAQTSISYISISNNFVGKNTKGLSLFVSSNGTYNFSDKYGLSFYLRAINNLYSDQGASTGYFNYNLIFGRNFNKGKFVISGIAENFLMPRRHYKSEYQFKDYTYYTDLSRPYRLFKLRIAYRISTIVMDKKADRFLPTKRREASNDF